ncbi:MAG TPA: hypothetical protein ENK96_03390 [Desulfobulbaceae bacterium]|nr:hypothetical protein [Desulfobulbaceae bacterium]
MDILPATQLIVDSALLVLIWLVQLIIYPSLGYTEKQTFIFWHDRYSRIIALIVIPLVLIQAGVEVIHFMQQDVRTLRILLLSLIWLFTFFVATPVHYQLHCRGKNKSTIKWLDRSNWLRTISWTIIFMNTTAGFLTDSFG